MARPIVTQAAVEAIADTFVEGGLEPSIVEVQKAIGGGSYGTVKRYLDAWKTQRDIAAKEAPVTPPEILKTAQEFARATWVLASREAQLATKQERDIAQTEVARTRDELVQAQVEIGRLENIESAQIELIDQLQKSLRAAEFSLAEAQAECRRVQAVEAALLAAQAELRASQQAFMEKSVGSGRLEGEVDALRTQVRELMAAINPTVPK